MVGVAVVRILKIKLPVKYPVLGKCENCLKFDFGTNNEFNFVGNLGGQWDNSFKNGQKVYQFNLFDFSNPNTYGFPTDYRIFWKPNITGTFPIYGGGTLTINNEAKWIAVPSSSIGTVNELSNTTFFHALSNTSASCPFTPNPTNSTWNFRGDQGFFLLENTTPLTDKPCPTFTPTPGNINWGYNCGPNGCVQSPSGSVGTYATLAQCQVSCSINPTSSFEYNCTPNGCVQVPSGSGSFATLAECTASCNISNFITTCSCDGENILNYPSFDKNLTGWSYGPNPSTPGIGTWSPSETPTVIIEQSFNIDNTSSVFISQEGVLNPSCSYDICFQAWTIANPSDLNIAISLDTGIYPIDPTHIITNLTPYPVAYTLSLQAGQFNTTDLTLYFSSPNGSQRVNIDNFCVIQRECLPYPGYCMITGSTYCYSEVDYGCDCPDGFVSNGSGSCVGGGTIYLSKQVTGTPITNYLLSLPYWGIERPLLYYYNNNNGVPSSSIFPGTNSSPAHPSSFFGDPRVYNTQWTYDILSSSFWYGYNPDINLTGYANKLLRSFPIDDQWYGGGSFINVTSSKTYYIGITGDDLFRVSVNGSTIVETLPYGLNSTSVSGQYVSPYAPQLTNIQGYNWTYLSLHIYPIELTTGCNYIVLEGRDTNDAVAGIGAVIFDMTPEEIVNATSENDLNVIWDSRTDLLFNLNTGITASCPPGSTPVGPDPCDLCEIVGPISIPCGSCIECVNGRLYNGYVVDKGGPNKRGRGNGGIVNINSGDNPINTWVIPNENDWNQLITYLNNGVSPLTTTVGNLDVVSGGKMKDYTRDNIASCWQNPNVGAQTDENSSGWAGVASGRRIPNVFSPQTPLIIFEGLGLEGYWWSANSGLPAATTMAVRNLKFWSNDVYRYILTKNHGCSIRLFRPTEPGETDGTLILDAYLDNDGTLYDGIVIGNQVWITKNLSDTRYNNGSFISTGGNFPWVNSLSSAIGRTCVYDNNDNNLTTLSGNIDPLTGLCYEYPTWFVYRRCGGTDLLIQTEPGATTSPGRVQKADDYSCWEFVEETQNNSDVVYQLYVEGNYFENNTTVYGDCEECNAIHTIYLNFGSKNC